MRTLSKPKPPKQKGKTEEQSKNIGEKKEVKTQSKKIAKTVFNDPFRYKMYKCY